MRLKGDNTCSVVAGYLSHAVTVIESLQYPKPLPGKSAQIMFKKGPVLVAFWPLPQKGILQPPVLADSSWGVGVLEKVLIVAWQSWSSLPVGKEIGPGWFGEKDPKFPNCGAEGVGRAVLDGDWR